MIWIVFALVAIAFAISVSIGAWLVKMGSRLGRLDQPGAEAHKQHTTAVPSTGGIAVFWGIAAPVFAILVVVLAAPEGLWQGLLEPVGEHLAGLRDTLYIGAGVLGGIAVMHVLGRIDDRRGLGPFLKLGVQVAVAAALVIFFDMRILSTLGQFGLGGTIASVLISIAWIIVITNAMNFLDNMDGLTGGVGAIVAGLYVASTLTNGQWFVAALAALLLGSLLGFLVFNFPPARFFMGDGGSLVVGLMLAIISIRTNYFDPQSELAPAAWYGVLMPLMLLAIPLYDFTSVTVIRVLAGKSPFRGDQNHFSHRLVRKGLSRRTAVLVIWLCTLATGLGGVMLGSLSAWQACIAFGQTAAILALLALLERSVPTNGGK